MWTNTSLEPSSGWINPNPFATFKNFTFPIGMSHSWYVSRSGGAMHDRRGDSVHGRKTGAVQPNARGDSGQVGALSRLRRSSGGDRQCSALILSGQLEEHSARPLD